MEEKEEGKIVVATKQDGEIIKKSVKPVISKAYILSDDSIVSESDLYDNERIRKLFNDPNINKLRSGDLSLEMGSSQDSSDEKEEEFFTLLGKDVPIVEPPYDVIALGNYLQRDEIHYRCCLCKVIDSVGRGYAINPRPDLLARGKAFDDELKEKINEEINIVKSFIRTCNQASGFLGVLKQAALGAESIGFSGIEVIRGKDKKVKRIVHVPSRRLRVLRGWRGFVEEQGSEKTKIYYMPFGTKLIIKDTSFPSGFRPFDPFKDKIEDAHWNLIDRYTGQRIGFDKFEDSANEVIWIQKHHPSTIYYGLSDVIPALASVVANIYINTYGLQFFENNAIPHYAIIVEGAEFSPDVVNLIKHYFKNDIKGENRSTLIIPVPDSSGEVRVRFEQLSAEEKEGSFQQYRKNNQQAIMVAHGVSPAIIGVTDAASLGSGKGRAQYENYRDRIIEPSQRYWEEKVNDLLQKGLGVTHVILEFDAYNIQDDRELSEVMVRYLDRAVLSVNEVRKIAKLGDPVKGGDKRILVVGRDIIDLEELDNENIGNENNTNENNNTNNTEEKIQNVLNYVDNSWEEIQIKVLKDQLSKSPACRLDGETEQECVKRKIPEILRENPNMSREQAVAIAYSLCSKRCSEKGDS